MFRTAPSAVKNSPSIVDRGLYHSGRRAERVCRPGRRTKLPRLRRDHDEERELLPVYEFREYERMQLDSFHPGGSHTY